MSTKNPNLMKLFVFKVWQGDIVESNVTHFVSFESGDNMGKSKIAKAGPSTPVRQVRWRTVTTGGQSKDKIIKAPPRKMAHIDRPGDNWSPTQTGLSGLEDTSLFLNEPVEAYSIMDDPPL